MEDTFLSRFQNSYPPRINGILELLSRAGVSVVNINYYIDKKIGTIYDLLINRIIDEETFNKLYVEITARYSYTPLQLKTDPPILRLIPLNEESNGRDYKKIALLFLTIMTVYFTGYGLSEFYTSIIHEAIANPLILGAVYTLLFMFALVFHEYGHMRAARRYNVVIKGPYFIPAPPIQLGFIGTLGAVITMKNLPPDKQGLAKLGINGPLYGYLAGLAVAIIGVLLSPIIPVESIKPLIEKGEVSEMGFLPLTLQLLLFLRAPPPGYTILLHPLAFIGFVVFIVTFLNLIPIGQLDGGHVIRSYINMKSHDLLGYIVILLSLITGLLLRGDIGTYYLSLSIILLILKLIVGRYPHPGPANQYAVKHTYKYLLLYIALLVLTIPIPS